MTKIVVLSMVLAGLFAPAGRAAEKEKVILFFGDSLTFGLGLERPESYPSLIQERIDAKKWPYTVVNASVSGETTADGLRRLDWVLRRRPDIFVLALGANDGLRGLSLPAMKSNLQAIVDKVRRASPGARIVVAGMKLPPNYGADYAGKFFETFGDIARKNGAVYLPFLLDGVGGNPDLNFPDGVHPNARGQKRVAENVWAVLEPLLRPRP